MKIPSRQLAIGIVCIALGLVLTLQFKNVQQNYPEWIAPTQKAQELASQIKTVRKEKEQLLGEIDKLEEKMREIEEAELQEGILVKSLRDELEKYKMISGVMEMKGPGVTIVVDDPPADPEYPPGTSVVMINYDLLLSLINKLNDAGVEGISINDQRIVSGSEVHLAGNNVNINSVPSSPPFIIKAIGDPNTLEAALNMRFGIIWDMRRTYNLQVSIKKQDEIILPKYNEVIQFRHAQPVASSGQ